MVVGGNEAIPVTAQKTNYYSSSHCTPDSSKQVLVMSYRILILSLVRFVGWRASPSFFLRPLKKLIHFVLLTSPLSAWLLSEFHKK